MGEEVRIYISFSDASDGCCRVRSLVSYHITLYDNSSLYNVNEQLDSWLFVKFILLCVSSVSYADLRPQKQSFNNRCIFVTRN